MSESIGRQLESTQRLLDSNPTPERECLDCGVAGAMKLQNIAGLPHANIPLLYLCSRCGAMLTIPPRVNPVA